MLLFAVMAENYYFFYILKLYKTLHMWIFPSCELKPVSEVFARWISQNTPNCLDCGKCVFTEDLVAISCAVCDCVCILFLDTRPMVLRGMSCLELG